MKDARSFLANFRRVAIDQGWRTESPFQIVDEWKQFVEFCEEGYIDNIYEYYNDLTVRNRIETLFKDENIQLHEEMDRFRSSVAEIDSRFDSLLQE